MATEVDSALAEITDALATIGPEIEGLLDYDRMLDKPEEKDAKNAVAELYQQYKRRSDKLTIAKDALNDLLSDGYPAVESGHVSSEVLATLTDNRDTVLAAFGQFVADQVSGGDITLGDPVPKDK
jgi:hypothetical protein